MIPLKAAEGGVAVAALARADTADLVPAVAARIEQRTPGASLDGIEGLHHGSGGYR